MPPSWEYRAAGIFCWLFIVLLFTYWTTLNSSMIPIPVLTLLPRPASDHLRGPNSPPPTGMNPVTCLPVTCLPVTCPPVTCFSWPVLRCHYQDACLWSFLQDDPEYWLIKKLLRSQALRKLQSFPRAWDLAKCWHVQYPGSPWLPCSVWPSSGSTCSAPSRWPGRVIQSCN